MKAEINDETKKRFIAAHWGQLIGRHWDWGGGLMKVDHHYIVNPIEKLYLGLKPLILVSAQDCIEIAKIFYPDFSPEKFHTVDQGQNLVSHIEKNMGLFPISKTNSAIGFLRRKGYAVEFEGLSVQELIDACWSRLKLT